MIIRHPVDAILAYWKWTINYEHSETLRHTDNPPAQYFGMIIIVFNQNHNNLTPRLNSIMQETIASGIRLLQIKSKLGEL